MACIEKIECEECGSSDARQVFYNEGTDSFSTYCFACSLYGGNPYEGDSAPKPPKPKTEEEVLEEVQEIKKCAVLNKKYRSLPANCFAKWGVRQTLSEHDGKTPWSIAYGYTEKGKLVGWKLRCLHKKFFYSVGNCKDSEPFGFHLALRNANQKLFITEGENDAIALDLCLTMAAGAKYKKVKNSVISLSNGADSVVKNLNKIRSKIKGVFKEVILCFDDDEAGQAAVKKAQTVMPNILTVSMPPGCKDPHDAYCKNLGAEMGKLALWGAVKPPLEGIVRTQDVLARASVEPTMGLSYPWDSLTELSYGQRFGEAVCLGAGVGIGKTVTAHEMMAWNMTTHGLPCFAVLLEEQNHHTLRSVASKIDSKAYNNPKAEFDNDQFIATAQSLGDKLFMWESDGDQYLRFDMDEIISAVRFNAEEYGCKFVYIDNFTRLVDHLEPSEANAFINKYASELEGLATQLSIHIMTYSHLNTPKGGASHEEGAPVYPSQFTGSRGIMRSFPMLMSFRRNKHHDIEGYRNNSYIEVLKNRKFGSEGKIKTTYNPLTGRLLENLWPGELTD